MLRIIESTSVGRAMSYFSMADYLSEGQELVGQWRGEGAKRLGLLGEIKKTDWDALCNNRNPASGNKLTLRHKENRRVGYDFNFHVPKSVSLLYSLTKDERILDALRESVNETMRDMESEMQTRVRKAGENEKRSAGNMVWGEYVHFMSRPVGGVPDPHCHIHAYVFNATWDAKESAWKAGEFADLKRDAPYFEAKFHSRMARRLAELGIAVERSKTGWEIAGIPKSAIRQFSRRTALIEEEAKRKGILDPAAKSELGAKTREHKKKDLTFDQLRADWSSRLSENDRAAIAEVGTRLGGKTIGEEARAPFAAVRHAAEHWFERKSVVPERTLLAEAMKHAIGKAGPEAVEKEFRREKFVFGERDGRQMATTREVLAEEMRMLAFARGGRGTERPLGKLPHAFRQELNDGQRRAVEQLLGSRDRVMLLRGPAGTGKTRMMRELADAVETGGRRLFAFAPTTDASHRVLRGDGFRHAETVARLLVDTRLQERIRGQVVWVDEAGQLGSRSMARLFDLAETAGCRVILSGDRMQHGPVERGAALRQLEEEAGLVPAELKDIRRQAGEYKLAVKALSEGRTEDGFKQLQKLGWVRDVPAEDRYRMLAADYVKAVAAGKTALVVSPTHREGAMIASEIRDVLKKRGRIGKDERTLVKLSSGDLTTAERRDLMHYAPGHVLEFNQNAKGYRKGQRLTLGRDVVPLEHAASFQLYRPGELQISKGDLLRFTKNGRTADGKHRLNNGSRYTVKGFTKTGDIVLAENGWTVSKDFGHWDHGYCSTSHASQGATVNRVFIGQSAASFAASSREQFYVSVSRGSEQATIYTDDQAALAEAIRRSDDRLAAVEFVNLRRRREHGARLQSRKAAISPPREEKSQEREAVNYER
jgi:conjugative relaxase-like TrwC/TraI family protein